MERKDYHAAMEAILFASGEPVELSRLAQALELKEAAARELLVVLQEKYEAEDSGLSLVELNGSYQLCTKPQYAGAVKAALELKRSAPLSNAAMEVLAIIAYNQPVTRGFIEQVRGVDSSQTVATLVERGLVEEAGRLDVPGRPIAFRTTAGFLRSFRLTSLEELPPLPDESGQVMLDEVVGQAASGGEETAGEDKG